MSLTSSNPTNNQYLRGDIWYVKLDPTTGNEIKKTRPAVIISSDGIQDLLVKLIVPIRGWKASDENTYWCVPLEHSIRNGLAKKSTADVAQTRCISVERLDSKIGTVSLEQIEDIVSALAAIIDYA